MKHVIAEKNGNNKDPRRDNVIAIDDVIAHRLFSFMHFASWPRADQAENPGQFSSVI